MPLKFYGNEDMFKPIVNILVTTKFTYNELGSNISSEHFLNDMVINKNEL